MGIPYWRYKNRPNREGHERDRIAKQRRYGGGDAKLGAMDINSQQSIQIKSEAGFAVDINWRATLAFNLALIRYLLAMSKDAIMVAIDAGSSMDQPFSDNASRLKIAMECFKLTLQQKIFNNASHEVGFSLFGDNQSEDGNNYELQSIARPTLELVRKVVQLSEAELKNTRPGGDIFNAIQFIVDRIAQHCVKKKYNKRAFIFTNGMGATEATTKTLERIVDKLKQNQIKLNIIPLDFMENYDLEENVLEGESFLEPAQEKNAALLMKLRSREDDNIQIFPASLAIELYKKFRKRDVNPVALYRGNLEVSPGLCIEVATYKGIRRQKLKSLQKYDTTLPWDPRLSENKEIINDISYVIEGDQTGTVIDKEKQINAYPYGPNLIPVSGLMEAGARIFEEKNFKLLGFVDKNKIPRHCLMGEADIVVPSDNALSKKLFTAFIYSMISLNRYAIARYVPRNNKNGVSPKLVVLMPYRTAERELFYLIELPTAEDIREYPFNGLKKATEKQRELVKDLVDRMSLYRNEDGEETEQVKMENTFNPVHQYFYQTVFHRALHNEDEIPELDPVIRNYISPEVEKYKQTEDLSRDIKKEFKLNKKQLASQKAKEKKAVVWKDILSAEGRPLDTLSMADTELEEPVLLAKKFNFEDDDEEHLNPATPLVSFRSMLTNNRKDLVDTALKEMVKHIVDKASTAINKQDVKHVVECAAALRYGCVEQHEEEFWDNWLQNCQDEIGEEAYRKLISEGLGFIKKSNQQVYRAEELHPVVEEEFDELD